MSADLNDLLGVVRSQPSAIPSPDGSTAPTKAIRFLRLADVLSLSGIGSKSELYRRIRTNSFPPGVRLSHSMVVWPEPVIAAWQRDQLPEGLKGIM